MRVTTTLDHRGHEVGQAPGGLGPVPVYNPVVTIEGPGMVVRVVLDRGTGEVCDITSRAHGGLALRLADGAQVRILAMDVWINDIHTAVWDLGHDDYNLAD